MVYTDPLLILKAALDTITLIAETGGYQLEPIVRMGWLEEKDRNADGTIRPTYTITRGTSPSEPLDANDSTSKITLNAQVDVWCTEALSGKEKSLTLMEKMLEGMRTAIRTYRRRPGGSVIHMKITSETCKDEPDKKPVLRRTMVIVQALCFR